MPGGRGNVDHIAVAPSGVYVIDTKDLTGKVAVRTPVFGQPKLLVAGRDRTKLVDRLERQVAVVREAARMPRQHAPSHLSPAYPATIRST